MAGRRDRRLSQTGPIVHRRAGRSVARRARRAAWEIAIKRGLGKLEAPADLRWRQEIAESASSRWPITFDHAREAGELPRHHADPFDRMLVAQARLEGLTLVTADPNIARYDVAVLRP